MTIQIKTIDIEPKRQTFGHIARRIGEGKTASRYQEATLDVQATANFHYKPLGSRNSGNTTRARPRS